MLLFLKYMKKKLWNPSVKCKAESPHVPIKYAKEKLWTPGVKRKDEPPQIPIFDVC